MALGGGEEPRRGRLRLRLRLRLTGSRVRVRLALRRGAAWQIARDAERGRSAQGGIRGASPGAQREGARWGVGLHLAALLPKRRVNLLLRELPRRTRGCARQACAVEPSERPRVVAILCHRLKLPAHGRQQVNAEHCRNRKTPAGHRQRGGRTAQECGEVGRERTQQTPSKRSGRGPPRPSRVRRSCGSV